ncbi:hypothetical protein K376_00711 [Streptomyces sp. PsTaAH-130]|nr:hypothetical protein K376_00711 [Streptomyces sp. PsTaAH-130]
MAMVEPGEIDADPAGAASVLAFAALQAVQAAPPKYRASALGRLGRTEEADTEARQAYRTEQTRRRYRHSADAVAAATKAADEDRERTAQYLMAARLEQLREQAVTRTPPPPCLHRARHRSPKRLFVAFCPPSVTAAPPPSGKWARRPSTASRCDSRTT